MSDDYRGSDQAARGFRGRLGLDVAAEAELPGRGIVLQAGEKPAGFDSRDLLGDIEQGVDGGLDLEGGPEEVGAFQEGVDRSGEGTDLFGRNFEREVDGAARNPRDVERYHAVPRRTVDLGADSGADIVASLGPTADKRN
jgi:hypothetical protein